ncbi:DNA cytosine methyltransferase [Rubripirellula sp.]|nr:DNA cytosine methyltransferase [Rubripirellula sp.]MDB4634101.1 DNA cytosine methyltransferase [Rubripirellula sp.]
MTQRINRNAIPIIDLFAGPGGMSEGFARYPFDNPQETIFRTSLGVEACDKAHATLTLRHFTHQFPSDSLPNEYYETLQKLTKPTFQSELEATRELYDRFGEEAQLAKDSALCEKLGIGTRGKIARRIKRAVEHKKHWVLLGGPPCQAFSNAGVSRNKGIEGYELNSDHRTYLYQEFVHVLKKQLPSVFVMENVPGMLACKIAGKSISKRIWTDLSNPEGLKKRNPKKRYRLFSLSTGKPANINDSEETGKDFVVRMENYGVPQARHRVIILGIREDLELNELPMTLNSAVPNTCLEDVIADLPELRSGLSKDDTPENWIKAISKLRLSAWYKRPQKKHKATIQLIKETLNKLLVPDSDRGQNWSHYSTSPRAKKLKHWYSDPKLKGTLNHTTKMHMASDLHRYLFATCFAKEGEENKSPLLSDFPQQLLPEHKNVQQALIKKTLGQVGFKDRFTVQLPDKPASTITSHLHKDGHKFIHYDPKQCRAITPREAARIQTFPDNYYFCGGQSASYLQIGNAVPPVLSHQIAEIVEAVLRKAQAGSSY